MAHFDHDIIIIGGGAGGLSAAKTARGFAKRVAIVEKTDRLGGECTWTGCVPSKTLIKSAQVAYHAKHLKNFGLDSFNDNALDTKNVMNHIRAVIKQDYQSHNPEQIEKLGIKVLFGSPKFIDAHHIKLNEKIVSAKKFIIATGSSPAIPSIDGIETVAYLTNETIFDLPLLPKSIVILGGGAIGAEMASALNRLGVKVVVIEMQDRILVHEDQELVSLLVEKMESEGVTFLTGMRAIKVEQEESFVSVICQDKQGNTKKVSGEKFLVAVGRKPNIDGLDLALVGVTSTKSGIVVDATMRTRAKNIYAAGDVVGPYLFSHMAWYQAVAAVRNAIIPMFKQKITYNNVIWATFTTPELAAGGMTEQQAREQYGDSIKVYRRTYKEIDRAVTDCATDGLAKVICDKRGYVLGMHILGARAGDIIHSVQIAKVFGKRFADLHKVIHAYPTYAELLWHMSKKAYVDRLQGNFFIKILKRFFT